LIKTHIIDPDAVETAQRIASLTGVVTTPERWYTIGATEYWHIAGGIAWPTNEPGAVVIVGVKRTDPITFSVIEAVPAKTVMDLLVEVAKLKELYEPKLADLLQVFWGDWDRYQGLIGDFNLGKRDGGIYLSPPSDFDNSAAGLIYWKTIESYLVSGGKKLYLNGTAAAAEIQKVVGLGVGRMKAATEFPPMVMALGYCVHAIRAARPWEANASSKTYIPTTDDVLSQTAYSEEITLRELFGDTGDLDDSLVATI